jgi:hypothetical protein
MTGKVARHQGLIQGFGNFKGLPDTLVRFKVPETSGFTEFCGAIVVAKGAEIFAFANRWGHKFVLFFSSIAKLCEAARPMLLGIVHF